MYFSTGRGEGGEYLSAGPEQKNFTPGDPRGKKLEDAIFSLRRGVEGGGLKNTGGGGIRNELGGRGGGEEVGDILL